MGKSLVLSHHDFHLLLSVIYIQTLQSSLTSQTEVPPWLSPLTRAGFLLPLTVNAGSMEPWGRTKRLSGLPGASGDLTVIEQSRRADRRSLISVPDVTWFDRLLRQPTLLTGLPRLAHLLLAPATEHASSPVLSPQPRVFVQLIPVPTHDPHVSIYVLRKY